MTTSRTLKLLALFLLTGVVGLGGQAINLRPRCCTSVPVGPLFLPNPPWIGPVSSQTWLNNAGQKPIAAIFVVPKDGVLDGIETYTFKTSAQPVRVSFQDVSQSNGFPDGTADQFADFADAAIQNNGWTVFSGLTSDGTAGGVKRTVTKGQHLAVNFDWVSAAGTIMGFEWTRGSSDKFLHPGGTSYIYQNTTKMLTSVVKMALRYADGSYAQPFNWYPYTTLTQTTLSAGGTVERGMLIRIDKPIHVSGYWLAFSGLPTTAGNFNYLVRLRDSDNNVIGTHTFNGAVSQSPNLVNDFETALHQFTVGDVFLTPGEYRLTVAWGTGGSADIWDLNTANATMTGLLPGGSNWIGTSRTSSAAAWVDAPTRRPLIGLVVTEF